MYRRFVESYLAQESCAQSLCTDGKDNLNGKRDVPQEDFGQRLVWWDGMAWLVMEARCQSTGCKNTRRALQRDTRTYHNQYFLDAPSLRSVEKMVTQTDLRYAADAAERLKTKVALFPNVAIGRGVVDCPDEFVETFSARVIPTTCEHELWKPEHVQLDQLRATLARLGRPVERLLGQGTMASLFECVGMVLLCSEGGELRPFGGAQVLSKIMEGVVFRRLGPLGFARVFLRLAEEDADGMHSEKKTCPECRKCCSVKGNCTGPNGAVCMMTGLLNCFVHLLARLAHAFCCFLKATKSRLLRQKSRAEAVDEFLREFMTYNKVDEALEDLHGILCDPDPEEVRSPEAAVEHFVGAPLQEPVCHSGKRPFYALLDDPEETHQGQARKDNKPQKKGGPRGREALPAYSYTIRPLLNRCFTAKAGEAYWILQYDMPMSRYTRSQIEERVRALNRFLVRHRLAMPQLHAQFYVTSAGMEVFLFPMRPKQRKRRRVRDVQFDDMQYDLLMYKLLNKRE